MGSKRPFRMPLCLAFPAMVLLVLFAPECAAERSLAGKYGLGSTAEYWPVALDGRVVTRAHADLLPEYESFSIVHCNDAILERLARMERPLKVAMGSWGDVSLEALTKFFGRKHEIRLTLTGDLPEAASRLADRRTTSAVTELGLLNKELGPGSASDFPLLLECAALLSGCRVLCYEAAHNSRDGGLLVKLLDAMPKVEAIRLGGTFSDFTARDVREVLRRAPSVVAIYVASNPRLSVELIESVLAHPGVKYIGLEGEIMGKLSDIPKEVLQNSTLTGLSLFATSVADPQPVLQMILELRSLTELTVGGLPTCCLPDVLRTHRLTRLDWRASSCNKQWEEIQGALPDIAALRLEHIDLGLSPHGWQFVQRLWNKHTRVVRATLGPGDSFDNLKLPPNLEFLSLTADRETAIPLHFNALAGLTRLKRLHILSKIELIVEDAAAPNFSATLQELRLPPSESKFFEVLAKCAWPELRELDLAAWWLQWDPLVRLLASAPELQYLNLHRTVIDEPEADLALPSEHLLKLEKLVISRTYWPGEATLQSVAKLPRLRAFHAVGGAVKAEQARALFADRPWVRVHTR